MSEKIPPELEVLLTHLDWNLQRLDEVLKQEQSDYFKGAALQRFGHTYIIALKTIRAFSQWKGMPFGTDDECFNTAGTKGWLAQEADLKTMSRDYQRINEKPQRDVENVYEKLSIYHQVFNYLFVQLRNIS